MAATITHTKVSTVPDSGDTDDVQMSDWNANHTASISAADVGADAAGTASSAVSTHAGASDPHGDRSFATSAVGTHEADTTSIHGITNTASLETTSGSQGKVDTHAAASDPHTGYQQESLLFDATTPAAVGTAATGAATTAARRDHVHASGAGTPSTQAIGDAAATGTGPAAAMTDHKHAMPAFASPTVALGSSAAAGSAATLVRSDSTIAAFDATAPTTSASADAAAVGSAAFAARRDHVHGRETVYFHPTFSRQGPVAVTTDSTALRWYNHTGRTLTFTMVELACGTAPTGAAILVDVNVDGTTIFSTQGNRPTIAISGNEGNTTTFNTTTVADSHYITVNIDQIGSTVLGSDLTVSVWMKG